MKKISTAHRAHNLHKLPVKLVTQTSHTKYNIISLIIIEKNK